MIHINQRKGVYPTVEYKNMWSNSLFWHFFRQIKNLRNRLVTEVFDGRDNRIWTCGLFVPNEARYQTALYPDIKYLVFSIFPCLWDNMWSKLVWPHVFCFSIRHKVAVLKGLWEFGGYLMNWIVPCPERSALPSWATSRKLLIYYNITFKKNQGLF